MREVCAFNGCAKDYMNKRSLEIHVERKHNGKGVTEGDYRCPTCNVGFSQMKIMNRHNNGVHKKLYRMFSCSYTCNKCDLVGIMRDDRAVHASKCENYGLFFVFFNCEMMQPDGGGKCRYTTLNHSQMERHVIKHQEEQPPAIKRGKGSVFKCPIVLIQAVALQILSATWNTGVQKWPRIPWNGLAVVVIRNTPPR